MTFSKWPGLAAIVWTSWTNSFDLTMAVWWFLGFYKSEPVVCLFSKASKELVKPVRQSWGTGENSGSKVGNQIPTYIFISHSEINHCFNHKSFFKSIYWVLTYLDNTMDQVR